MCGKAAALNRFGYETGEGRKTPPLVSKFTDVHLRPGQKLRLETPGGGGFGDPATRLPERVARDVCLGYVTPGAAVRGLARLARVERRGMPLWWS